MDHVLRLELERERPRPSEESHDVRDSSRPRDARCSLMIGKSGGKQVPHLSAGLVPER